MTTSILQFQGRLRHIMEVWQGEQVYLAIQGKKVLVQPQYLDQQCSSYSAYSICSRNRKFNSILENNKNQSYTKHLFAKQNVKNNRKNGDYVFNAYEKSRQKNKSKKGKSFTQLAQQYRSNQHKKQKKNKSAKNAYEFDFPGQKNKFVPNYRKCPKYIIPDQSVQQKIQEQIQQSLKDLGATAQYQNSKVKSKIEILKKQMVEKLMQEGGESPEQLGEIIDQIKFATEQIIQNRSRRKSQADEIHHLQVPTKKENVKKFNHFPQPPLKKQLFSFEGMLKDGLIYEEDEQESQKNDQYEIKIPEFKDDNESISSIMSFNNDMNSPQVHKKKNINVVEAKDNLYCEEEGVKQNKENVNEDKIQEIKPSLIECQTPEGSELKGDKEFEQLPTTIQKISSPPKEVEQFNDENNKEVNVKETLVVAEDNNVLNTLKVNEKPTEGVRNYKIQFMESRVKNTQVIRLSPLRFRKKQEVVKHLVKHKIVEKESDSIEFLH